MILAVIAFVISAFNLGFWLAGRMEASYGAAHASDGGSVYHRGKFYRVTFESASGE